MKCSCDNCENEVAEGFERCEPHVMMEREPIISSLYQSIAASLAVTSTLMKDVQRGDQLNALARLFIEVGTEDGFMELDELKAAFSATIGIHKAARKPQ